MTGPDAGQSAGPSKPLLSVLNGECPAVPPMWLMRQAGRYLPEYRALRAEKGGFLELVYDSAAAAEVTLQPLRRFGFDGAILFSDILIIPYAMGQDLWFEAGEGPRLAPTLDQTDLAALKPDFSRFDAVYETVRQVKAALDPAVTFLGFAGSPWTIATYMVAGQGSKDQGAARRLAYNGPERFAAIIDAIVDATVTYLSGQIQAGVEAVQLFDSWAGSLAPLQFDRWVIAPNRAIVERLRQLHPGIPVIGFPKGAGAKLADYAAGTGVDAVGIDETVDPHWANRVLPAGLAVQGNLDPLALIAGGRAVEEAVDNIRAAFAGRPHIFNLGHGILPDTPVPHVEALITYLRQGKDG
ncbi:uroporphyrinogen decarboxylase [Sphingobium quisquiliarum P25]|uniref:Uroporphyrinogen decarboxylase n=1 Tax=Sphingobium quisquiliarum P25 TaxID=1329909 RepID=T0GZF4_9SPHN|nr:uroporphyrinogen decarboxylase [Sphingobium quisquiliarum]EQB06112.1 uroporphyrinogen decarboxylase [Sphingobium quisquiliarum P25]